jgi:hypothetical protein
MRPSWTRDLDHFRKAVRRLYDGGYRQQSGELGRWIQWEYRKRVREWKTRLAKELLHEPSPSRAHIIRRALGIVPRKCSAPELVRKTFAESICEKEADRLPIPLPTTFVVSSEFAQDIIQSVDRVKTGRAAGPDGVYGEMIRVIAPWVKHLMVDFWRMCGQMKIMPTMWHAKATEPAYKNGPTDDPSSYRL